MTDFQKNISRIHSNCSDFGIYKQIKKNLIYRKKTQTELVSLEVRSHFRAGFLAENSRLSLFTFTNSISFLKRFGGKKLKLSLFVYKFGLIFDHLTDLEEIKTSAEKTLKVENPGHWLKTR